MRPMGPGPRFNNQCRGPNGPMRLGPRFQSGYLRAQIYFASSGELLFGGGIYRSQGLWVQIDFAHFPEHYGLKVEYIEVRDFACRFT